MDVSDDKVEQSMKAAFNEVDTDRNGSLTMVEMGQVLHQMARKQDVPDYIIQVGYHLIRTQPSGLH